MASQREHEEVSWRVVHHPPETPQRVSEHDHVRSAFGSLMHEMLDLLPGCREASLVQTKLEEAMFWANAAVARQHPQASVAMSWRDTQHGQGVQMGDGNTQSNTFG